MWYIQYSSAYNTKLEVEVVLKVEVNCILKFFVGIILKFERIFP